MNDHSRVKVEIDVLLFRLLFWFRENQLEKMCKIVFVIMEIKSLLKSFHVNDFPFPNEFFKKVQK